MKNIVFGKKEALYFSPKCLTSEKMYMIFFFGIWSAKDGLLSFLGASRA